MKRFVVLSALALVLGAAVYAEESTLIDFSLLTANLRSGSQERGNPETFVARTQNDDGTWNDGSEGLPGLNQQTVMDFRNRPGINNLTATQRSLMRTSLAIENWLVELSSSSQTVVNNSFSYTKEATSRENFGGEIKVMGVRIHFPTEMYNGNAVIRPPFEIPAYDKSDPPADANAELTPADRTYDDKTRFEQDADGKEGYGVIKNVGTVKQISVNVYGLNFPHSLLVMYEDGDGVMHEANMGSLNFDGWATLTWENPNYVQDVRQRTLRLYPLYPTYAPYIKFAGFRIKRDAMNAGGDFIGYFKDVNVIYDKAVLEDPARDINDEKEWGIIQLREDNKSRDEQEHFGLDQIYRYEEYQKQARDVPFDQRPVTGQQAAAPAANQ